MNKKIVCTWSGGIDSTALIANLLKNNYEVTAVTLSFYGDLFVSREKRARDLLLPILNKLGKVKTIERDGSFLWNFSPDNKEIPRRNKLIMDHLLETTCTPSKIYSLGMGEYVGADSWVVTDHVSMADADTRSLSAYLYNEYGLRFRLITLADFGESRFKKDRIKLGFDVIFDKMFLTTNCLENYETHCGECYKCIERNVGFKIIAGADETTYLKPPEQHPLYQKYFNQMGKESQC